ncbi:hypothetical protein [Streptomyces abikoensis]|uniref:hypothetical protein n=1 Tax=Streptomyces abikoensis TaxID=97398 RepID=UPI0036A6C37A
MLETAALAARGVQAVQVAAVVLDGCFQVISRVVSRRFEVSCVELHEQRGWFQALTDVADEGGLPFSREARTFLCADGSLCGTSGQG